MRNFKTPRLPDVKCPVISIHTCLTSVTGRCIIISEPSLFSRVRTQFAQNGKDNLYLLFVNMPRKCCANVCKTKYDSKKDEENCHVFGFPTDKTPGCAARRKAWVSERVTIIDQFLPFTARFMSEYAVFFAFLSSKTGLILIKIF